MVATPASPRLRPELGAQVSDHLAEAAPPFKLVSQIALPASSRANSPRGAAAPQPAARPHVSDTRPSRAPPGGRLPQRESAMPVSATLSARRRQALRHRRPAAASRARRSLARNIEREEPLAPWSMKSPRRAPSPGNAQPAPAPPRRSRRRSGRRPARLRSKLSGQEIAGEDAEVMEEEIPVP